MKKMGNKFLSAKSEMDELLETKKQVLTKAGNIVARVFIDMNVRGISDTKIITENIDKLIDGFTYEEKIEILKLAMAKAIINL